MNTRQINPTTTWSPTTGNITLDTLVLKDFNHYFFDGGGGTVSYCLQDSQTQIEYFGSSMVVPSNVLSQWGASDDIIFEYVASQLNLTLINN